MSKKRVIIAFISLLWLSLLFGCGKNSASKNLEADTEVDTEVDTDFETKTEVDTDFGTEAEVDTDFETETETETETIIGYISNINIDDRTFTFDPIEWITMEDTKRIEELGIADGDFPNGFYRYNPVYDVIECTVSEDAKFCYLNWNDNFTPTTATFEEFVKQHNEFFTKFYEPMEESFENFTPYWVDFKDGVVIDICQQYVP